jgi:hypothetical protein
MDVLTLCAELDYDLKDAELVDDMLLKVQGVRLRALLEDFKSRAPATSSVAVVELEVAPHALRAPLAVAISAASIEHA